MTASRGILNYGDRAAQEVSLRVGGNCATTAVLTALSPKLRADGMLCVVAEQPWVFVAGSTTGASGTCLVPDDVSSNSGRWKTASLGQTGPTGASGTNGSTGATGALTGSGASGQTTSTGISGIRLGTGLSCSVANGIMTIWTA